MGNKKKRLSILTVSLILCVVSMIGACIVQTGFGKIKIKDLRWETPSGYQMSALLYIPNNATKDTPAPGIVTSHGWYNNREMQDLNAIEYARRGYVVMVIDMYGHGNSEAIPASEWPVRGTGMYDAVELMADLPYVDKERIGVTGHSNGARACNLSVDEDNLRENPLISAVLLVANDPTYKDPETKVYYNKYGSRDVGVIAAQYDEFFFRTKNEDGTRTVPRDYIHTDNAQSFLNFGIDPKVEGEVRTNYTMYQQEIDGRSANRIIYTPGQIHPWNHFSKNCVTYAMEFFEKAFGLPHAIVSSNQVWQIKVIFNFIGLVGFVMFIVGFTKFMLNTATFKSLKVQQTVKIASAPQGVGKAWFWGGLLVSALISGISYLPLGLVCNKIRPHFFLQSPVFFIGVWSAFCGICSIVIMCISYKCFSKKQGMDLRKSGVIISAKTLGKTISLALIVVIAAFSIVFIADYLFKVDFRTWVIAIKAFTPDKIIISLLYVPFFLLFYIANSIAINCFNYVSVGKKEWINTALLALTNGIGGIVICVIQYGSFFITGDLFFKSSSIGPIWLFPIIIILPVAAIISRKIYRMTKNPYLAGIINALIITLISCSNTLTQL